MWTLVTNALLIDGKGGKPQANSTIEIVDGRFGKIGKVGDFGDEVTRADETIDAKGKAIVPGLINGHDHLTWRRSKGSFAERVGGLGSDLLMAKGVGNCLISLVEGVTTVRDVGAKGNTSLALKRSVADGSVIGPRIFTCGQVLVMTGGHASEGGHIVDGVDNVRQAARHYLALGADLIKLMASGGYVSLDRDLPTSPQYSLGELKAAAEEAHDQGKPTTVHCHAPAGIRRAVEAGIDCIEHAGLLDEPTAELMHKHSTQVVPTLNALHSMVRYGTEFGRSPGDIERSKGRIEQSYKSFRIAVAAGLKVGAGVDALGNLFEEIGLFVEGGMAPLQAITAATLTNAEILGVSDQIGTIATGKRADLLLVDGNPADNIGDLRRISITMKDGVTYCPEELKKAIGPALPY